MCSIRVTEQGSIYIYIYEWASIIQTFQLSGPNEFKESRDHCKLVLLNNLFNLSILTDVQILNILKYISLSENPSFTLLR